MSAQITLGAAHPARQLALGPYVQRIRVFCLQHAAESDGMVRVRLGDRALALEPPEFALLVESARAGPEAPGENLPVEILSLLAKCAQDLASLRASTDPTSRAVYALQAELMLDSALGTVLLAETQRRVDGLIARGAVEPARVLSQLCHRLRHAVSEVGNLIAESERVRAGDLAASLAGESVDEPAPRGAVRAEAVPELQEQEEVEVLAPRPRPSRARRRAAKVFTFAKERQAAGLSSTSFLGMGLLLVCAACLYLFTFAGFDEPQLAGLMRGDFRDIEVVTRVEARPPSLFGRVDAAAWGRLDDAARLAVVAELSRVLSAHHYSGALLETEDGRPVAQWLESTGASLIDGREE